MRSIFLALAITLTVDQAELKLIADALGARPFSEVAPLIQKLGQQVQEQMKPPVPQTEEHK